MLCVSPPRVVLFSVSRAVVFVDSQVADVVGVGIVAVEGEVGVDVAVTGVVIVVVAVVVEVVAAPASALFLLFLFLSMNCSVLFFASEYVRTSQRRFSLYWPGYLS